MSELTLQRALKTLKPGQKIEFYPNRTRDVSSYVDAAVRVDCMSVMVDQTDDGWKVQIWMKPKHSMEGRE